MIVEPTVGRARSTVLALSGLLLVLVAWLALRVHDRIALSVAMLLVLLFLGASWRIISVAEARAESIRGSASELRAQLEEQLVSHDSLSNDLELLGRYGKLLIGCSDLAEVLQISEQMLSLLLPEVAGTIYPLIDGEGLAEATHLWGKHVGDTKLQASSEECRCVQSRSLQLGNSEQPESLCAHVLLPAAGESMTAACIPLVTKGESLGWIYLSAPGIGPLPKLKVAVAAADQLALALANLKLRQNLRDLSVRDPLTGLFNRRYLSESLGREIARCQRRGLPLAVLAFDLDRFKDFNDRFGHPAGDAILVAFSRVLQTNSRSEDIACRQGGEEFVVIMPEMDRGVALRRAIELMAAMAQMDVVYEGQMLPKLTTSIGLAIFPEHGATPLGLLAQADQALYQAKSNGRNRLELATPA